MPNPATVLPPCTGELIPLAPDVWSARAPAGEADVTVWFPVGPAFLLDGADTLFVLPSNPDTDSLAGSRSCWVLPELADSGEPAWLVQGAGSITARRDATGWRVVVAGAVAQLTRHRARPHADVAGDRFALDLDGGDLLADALAGFYWDTMLPSVIERTTARDYPDSDGYVVSTLADRYLGTYPDVDHEFQIKGRLAWGSLLDQHVVRRMLELQFRLMREDPAQLWRDPCAVQPDGTREYHVRRNSRDGTSNAEMFLVTGNIEVCEEAWLYVASTRDIGWLAAHIADLEGAASGIEAHIDQHGRLWGDVYYEDQVIKDGRETMAQALAVRSFRLLADLEGLLGRDPAAVRYHALADRLAASLHEPLPTGWWDADQARFVDWVDRDGLPHDHLHLLANQLPVLVGAATAAQECGVADLVARELAEYQRFPTFLSARIADYTDSEIGDGGPYDLCAAGRYWCWDAAYWQARGDGARLRAQLEAVAAMGAQSGYIMGERYDLDHVYYVDGSPWHGAAHYYEYPCVFSWVLVHEYLGVRPALDVDLEIAPRLTSHGAVTLGQQAYRLRYEVGPDGFTLQNLADVPRTFRVDLGGLYPDGPTLDVTVAAQARALLPAGAPA